MEKSDPFITRSPKPDLFRSRSTQALTDRGLDFLNLLLLRLLGSNCIHAQEAFARQILMKFTSEFQLQQASLATHMPTHLESSEAHGIPTLRWQRTISLVPEINFFFFFFPIIFFF